MGRIAAIDLGTTNSCIAVLENGQPLVVPNLNGGRTTPSVIAYSASGELLLGEVAKRQSVTNPHHTVLAIKRLMGARYDAQALKPEIERACYDIIAAENGDAWVRLGERTLSPPDVSALILEHLKYCAEQYMGEDIDRAVITVPAYFNDAQRQATKDAGRIAGLEVVRVLNEPTAAALAYQRDSDQPSTIAVYDLGGGTFDISLVTVDNGVYQVKASCGDTHLGGEDFDAEIVNLLAQEFQAEHGVDLRAERTALQRLKDAAEKAKQELSSASETSVNLPFICATQDGPQHLERILTRAELEERCAPLVEQTLAACRQALLDADLKTSDIEDVLLVGGMTRMPLVQERVASFFKRKPNLSVNPDEVVAEGAAIQASIIEGHIDHTVLLDVTPLTLGVETAGGVMTIVISRNSSIPIERTRVFSTTEDNQPLVSVHVLQGERSMAEDNMSLARFDLVGIPPAPRGVPQIAVQFHIDSDGILHVEATDEGTGRTQSMKVTGHSGLSEEEIAVRIAEASKNKTKDEVRKQLADWKNRGKGLLISTRRSLDDYAHFLGAEDLELIDHDLDALEDAIDAGDLALIQSKYEALETSAYRIAECVYAKQSSDNAGS